MKTNLRINKTHINKKVTLIGWVNKIRKLGELIFIDLRNNNELVQILITKNNKNFLKAKELGNEFIIEVKGKVVKRKNINRNIYSGEIEIIADSIKIISQAEQTPLIIDEETDALEKIRMQYRYLDLRRPNIMNLFIQRSKFMKIIRDYFHKLSFLEIETPIITKPSVGGADELKVLSQNHKGKYYSLVQSPQIYKQLLIYSGFNKYFQIAKCFRDEDSRSDRQLEFTQLDMEVSFSSSQKIQSIIEILMVKLFKDIKKVDLKIPFKKITYKEAIENYGSDKPDIRFKNQLYEITDIFSVTKIDFVKNLLTKGNEIFGLGFNEKIEKLFIKKLEKKFIQQGIKGISWIRIENSKFIDGSIDLYSSEEIKQLVNIFGKNVTILYIVGKRQIVQEVLGRIRIELAEKLNLIKKNVFSFVWVIDWPLFKKVDKKFESMHNPFTAVQKNQEEMLLNGKNLDELIAQGYDLVLNGNEIGGGSIRINDYKLQKKVFEILNLSEYQIADQFGWFLRAQRFGIPYHGGIALGLDRILSIVFDQKSIREVIAFPKTTHGTDDMTGAPININKL